MDCLWQTLIFIGIAWPLLSSFCDSGESISDVSPTLRANSPIVTAAIIIIIIIIIIFMQGIYNYVPETNHVSTVYSQDVPS
jgi:hypothetical protein